MEGVHVRPPTQEANDDDEVDQELEEGLLSLFTACGGAGIGGSDDDESDTEEKGRSFVTETYTRLDPKADPPTLELSLAAGRHSLWGTCRQGINEDETIFVLITNQLILK
jgi:hypothetical protein